MRAPLAALALTVALLAGCSGQAPGTAAVVDGQRISEGEVASVVDELNPYLQQPLSPAQALTSIIQAHEIVDIAAENGLGVSDQQAIDTLEGLGGQLEVETPDEFAPSTVLVARSLVVLQNLSQDPSGADVQQELATRLGEVDATISPRYGTWDASGAVAPPTYDWIIAPATPS